MNLRENHSVAQKHRVGVISDTHKPFQLKIVLPRLTPSLDERVAKWRDVNGNPFPPHDIVQSKVAFGELERDTSILACFPSSWAEYTIMRNKVEREALPEFERFRFLAVCGVLETTDYHFALAHRSKKVTTYQGMWHVSAAGSVSLSTVIHSMSPTLQFFQELQEEVGVLPCDITDLTQLGLCDHLWGESPSVEVCFHAKVQLSSTELLERAKKAKDNWEGEIYTFPIEEVRRMLTEDSGEMFNPGGAATLILALEL